MSDPRLSLEADLDLDEINAYLRRLPAAPAAKISFALEQGLVRVAALPMLGMAHSELTRLLGEEIRSQPTRPYRIFYRVSAEPVEIIAILHMARDVQSILRARFS